MSDELEKLKLHSPDWASENIHKLAEIFPNCVTETQDTDGTIRRAIDYDQLRQELSDHIVDGPQERYHLNWPGKREALLAANAPIAKTLRPARDESVDFDTSQNLFIEGDNLEALKLLQETYLGKVKMIYIDPPYNTGRNLIYKNDYSETQESFLEKSGQASDAGSRLVANPETEGRFHSDWLTMIYARLRVAKTFLSKDGILVCAIDENEFPSLSLAIKEIFGEGGYEHSYVSVVHNPRGQQGNNFSYVNEYLIFVYPSDGKKYIADFKKEEVDARNLRDSGTESDRTDARSCFYPFIIENNTIVDIGNVPDNSFHPTSSNVSLPDGRIEVWPITDNGDEKKWRYARQSVERILDKLEPKMGRSSYQIIFNKDEGTMRSVWTNSRYDSSEYGTKLLDKLIDGAGFTYPKSLWAVYDSIFAATREDKQAVVMDFFAGSATTAHAVMQMNSDDGGNRSFIMVQVPEPIDEKSKPFEVGFKNIAEISKERIRRAGNKILEGDCHPDWNRDIGFRVLKVDASNMKDVYYRPDEVDQSDLLSSVDNIKDGRTGEDLLFQVLVDWGVDLTLPIRHEKIEGKSVYFVDDDALIACFETGINVDFVKQLATHKPLRVVFRDNGFASDDVKANVAQIFRQTSPDTDIKVI
jgi:adenine-specific DNA-methyltransferase